MMLVFTRAVKCFTSNLILLLIFNKSFSQNLNVTDNSLNHPSTNDDLKTAELYTKFALKFRNVNINQYEDHVNNLLELSSRKKLSLYFGKSLILQANILIQKQRFNELPVIYEKLDSLTKDEAYPVIRILSLFSKGLFNETAGKYPKALEYYFEGISVASRNNQLEQKAIGHIHIAKLFTERIPDLPKALQHINKAKLYLDGHPNDQYFNICYQNINANYHLIKKDYLSAFRELKIMEILCIDNTQKRQLASAYLNFGRINLRRGDLSQALSHFKKALFLAEEYKDVGLQLTILNYIAENNIQLGNYKSAIKNALDVKFKVYSSQTQAQNKYMLAKTHLILYKAYQHQQDYAMASKYLKLYNEAKNELDSTDVERKIALITSNHELKEKTFYLEKIENELKSEKTAKQIFLTTTLGSFCALMYLVYLCKKRKMVPSPSNFIEKERLVREKNELEMESRNAKIMFQRIAVYIKKRNDSVQLIISEINDLKNQTDGNLKKRLNKVHSSLKSSIRIHEKNGQLFELFSTAHQEFFKSMDEKCPNLTVKEKQLCALLELNLSTKEIAELNGVSERAIIMARHRLRKKLNLSPDENLSVGLNRKLQQTKAA